MITQQMLLEGYRNRIVRLIDSPNKDGTVCQIGNEWFYFGGEVAEDVTPEEYAKVVPEEDIIDEIYFTLKEFLLSGGELLEIYRNCENALNEGKNPTFCRRAVITRRIDDLGRIVVPRELLKALRIRDGDLMELTVVDGSPSILITKIAEDEAYELEMFIREFEGFPGHSVETERAKEQMLEIIRKYKEACNDKRRSDFCRNHH